MTHFKIETCCRSCGATDLRVVLDLGTTPLADCLVDAESLDKQELTAPLTLAFCPECTLVQILETVEPSVLFGDDYPYFSSVIPSLVEHFRDSAAHLMVNRNLGPDSLVVEAASNDGYMLRNFQENGIPILGIDPAKGPALAARKRGIPTRHDYFSKNLAKELLEEYPDGVDLFLANNVMAHVADLNGFVEGFGMLLKSDGVAVLEMHYLFDLVKNCEFDTIYHQHLCYFSVTSLDKLFRRHGLFLQDVQRTEIYGGSLRLTVGRGNEVADSVITMLAEEKALGVSKLEFYEEFAGDVKTLKYSLLECLHDLKSQGKSIAGYGAPAKATTLMAYAGIDKSLLEFVVDKNEHKQGCFLSVNRIPIFPPSKLAEENPDIVVIFAWNYAKEIIGQNKEFTRNGGHFLIPIPKPVVI